MTSSVLPPPTSSSSKRLLRQLGIGRSLLEKPRSASRAPVMISVFRPQARSMEDSEIARVHRIARRTGGDDPDADRVFLAGDLVKFPDRLGRAGNAFRLQSMWVS
jgi:hypothetical protein